MSHQVETAAAPPLRQRRGSRLVEWTLIVTICFGILSLCILEPLARNSVSVPNHNSKFNLPQTKNHLVGYRWISSKEAVVPLVEAFIGPRNRFTQELIYYQPSHNLSLASAESSQLPLGYSFPCNGQGGRRNNIFYPIDRLEYRLEPTERIFSKNEAIACLQSKTKWIHIDGDSLSRDILYDITELFGMGWNEKKKTLEDMEFTIGIRATFSGNTIGFSPHPNWVNSIQMEQAQQQDCPDLWIYASGLWDHPANTSESVYRKRTQALADYSNYSCVPYKILRYTTPYQKPVKNLIATNVVTTAYNTIATEILVPKGFHVVNAYAMMESRGDLTHDGVHYTGPGSKWITNAILNIICPFKDQNQN